MTHSATTSSGFYPTMSESETPETTPSAWRDWPMEKDYSEMTYEEKVAYLRDIERLDVAVSKHARRIRENLEADDSQEASE